MNFRPFLTRAFGLLSAGLLLGCQRDDVAGFDGEPTKAKVALINFANPALNAPNYGLVVKVDNKRQFDSPLNYGQTTGYFAVGAGSRTLSLDTSRANIQAATPEGKVYSATTTLNPDKYYSLITSGRVENPDITLTEDDVTRPAEGKVKIRFINVSPDSPAPVTLFYRLDTEPASAARPLFQGTIGYKQIQPFIEVAKGLYILDVRDARGTVIPTNSGAGSADPTVDPTINSGALNSTIQINFKEYKVYTLMLRGYSTPAASAANGNRPVALSTVINRYW